MEQRDIRVKKPSPWGKVIATLTLLAVVVTLVTQRRSIMGFARNWEDLSDGSVEAKQLRNLSDVLDYIAAHKDNVSLALFDIGAEADGFYLNADALRPLVSTVELQILLAYSAQFASGELSQDAPVSVEEWERYSLPRTDGGAHSYARETLEKRGAIKNGAVRLQDVVQAMVRDNDDAAADYLLGKLGRARVDAVPAQLGMPDEEPAWPMSGQILSWQNTQLNSDPMQLAKRYRSLERKRYADIAWQLFEALGQPQRSAAEHTRLDDDGLELALLEQSELTRVVSPRGRARAYAQLMARIARGDLPGAEQARAALAWPLKNPELQGKFDSVATKPGSLPSVLTSVYFARPKGHEKTRVLVLFLDHLPIAVWLQLMQKFLHERFELQLLGDDAFFEQVKQRLSQ